MPSFKPFSAVTGRNSYSLFDIRLDQDFIVFRGNYHESSGQPLRGVVVMCLSSPLRMEDLRLRLTGILRLSTPGVSGQKVDKTTTILYHRWAPFVGTHGKSMTLPAGNYEYPFEFTLPGDTSESVEGIPEASITYRLKATVGRGKLAYDLHAYKHLRIIRTLEPGALEFLHTMSVENIWPNKVDYSIVIPQKAVVFGGTINMELRFTPLLKGLELGEVTAKMVEVRDTCIQGSTGLSIREHRIEREVSTWIFQVNREEHWHDTIEDTGQEGWALTKPLNLPKRLRQCIQDLNHHGIKVRHKIKITVALKNPDGHISELRATLPVSIVISPNIAFDEHGNLVNQAPGSAGTAQDVGAIAPPGYGDHVLDQLYEDVDNAGFQTPGFQSGISSPLYSHSRTGSADNLAAMGHSAPVTPAALSSRLADVSLDPSRRNRSYTWMHSASGRISPTSGPHGSAPRSEPQSTSITRSNSEDGQSRRNSVEHVDLDAAEFAELNRVPSYATAVRTPARPRTQTASGPVPDYQTALSAPRTPPATDVAAEQLAPISEDATGEDATGDGRAHGSVDRTHSNDSQAGLALNLTRDQAL
ncbi:HECT-type ubiquitin ligase-interacting protein creD [Tolypocladium capitatum]|uniref:HECT-type ubiquitin ligase-interacting protein creD n=1 Tax=Tolypocladium capitatum TaxID=45235 RepID=A0A2K3QNQ1_9HYPO|nr:HECT-type ubiquitin ligase-interacting protein creD [Tolypocladium capitatum]